MTHLQQEIRQNQNYNGGGLATNITGKFESNRNALAKLDVEKRTAGEVAKSLRSMGLNFKAQEIKPFLEEWHHAGKLPKSYGGGMAKAYYTIKTDFQILKEFHFDSVKKELQKIENKKLKRRVCYGYYWVWDSDYSGYRGKKRNFKRVHFYKGNQLDRPSKNFTELKKREYEALKDREGDCFYGWDEPSF